MTARPLPLALLVAPLAACSASPIAAAPDPARPFVEQRVAEFDSPWALAMLPTRPGAPAAALVTERTGALWRVELASGKKAPIAGAPKVRVAGQGGLGDVALHPRFADNGRVYLSFVEAGPSGTSGAAIGTAILIATAPAVAGGPVGYRLDGWRVIWRQSPKVDGAGHFSHRMAFGPDGLLYVSSGDRQKFTPAQDATGNLGKILRLTDTGAAAPGNPWAARGGVAAQFWSIGHRNALGLAFDSAGRLWESEMGPKGGDELNLIVAGRNYGWPRASNGSHYDGGDIPDHRPGDGFEPPKAWWNPSISPGGLMIYDGALFPGWRGDAFLPALSGEALVRVDLDGTSARKAEQWGMDRRLRAARTGPEGAIYLLEDGGGLVRLVPAKAR